MLSVHSELDVVTLVSPFFGFLQVGERQAYELVVVQWDMVAQGRWKESQQGWTQGSGATNSDGGEE